MRALGVAVLGCCIATVGADAHAAEPAPRATVHWHDEWPRFHLWEGALTFGATVGVFVVERRVPEPEQPNLVFEVPLLDPTVRWMLRGRSEQVQRAFARYSDVGFRTMAFLPYVMDAAFGALVLHGSPDVAGQLLLIDMQALTLAGMTQLLVSRYVARQRPFVRDCVDGRTFNRECGTPVDNVSFFSGHAAGAFTSAGLVCLHHEHLPLFGGGLVEKWACAWAVGVASLTGIARIVYDAHYVSDVLVGAGVGWFYGYAMPSLLHFRHGKLASARTAAGSVRWTPALQPAGTDGAMLSVSGIF